MALNFYFALNRGSLFCFLLILSSSISFGQSLELNEVALFQRCYMQLTSQRVKRTHPLYLQVKNGQKSAIQACTEVLNKAQLMADNNTKISNTADEDAKGVLSTFHRLHASWFTSKDFPVLTQVGRNRDTKNIYDSTSPALYYTRALFKPNTQVRTVVTSGDNLKAVRADMDPVNGPDSGYTKSDYIFNPLIQFAPIGELFGVLASGPFNLSYPAYGKIHGAGQIDIYKTLGGGAIGSTPYLLLNLADVSEEYTTDGGVKMHRKWGKAVFNDFLCRDMPVVREQDVINMVDTKSTISFRTSAACTKCHASQDRVASLIRNLKTQSLGDGKSEYGQAIRGGIYPSYHATTLGAEAAWPVNPDPDYYKRPTTGTFYFRTYSGDLVNRSVASVSDLGQKISETEDFYICAAKRYYNYFIGVNVNTTDVGDPHNTNPLTTGDKYHRDIVISLGKNLRSHQNLRQTIIEILTLGHYRQSDFGIGGTGQ